MVSKFEILDKILWKLKYSSKPEVLQAVLNEAYKSRSTYLLPANKDLLIKFKELYFYPTENLNTLVEVPEWLTNIRPSDICLNLGACIGSVALPMAEVCSKVIAVEPLWFKELTSNRDLNGLKEKIIVLSVAVGMESFKTLDLRYGSKKAEVPTKALSDLFRDYRLTYLVCDIEGGEWNLLDNIIQGIGLLPELRELRIEFHIRRGRKTRRFRKFDLLTDLDLLEGFRAFFEKRNWKTEVLPVEHTNLSILFKRIVYFKASRKEKN